MISSALPEFFSGKPLPSLSDVLSTVRVVQIPMRVKFRGVWLRETALIEGPAGWGEFAPFLEYEPCEASAWLACALEAAWLGFPRSQRTRVPLNATVPAVAPDRVESVLAHYEGEIHEVKVKVAELGQSIDDDVARVRAVRQCVPGAGIKVDANAGWSEDQAVCALERLGEWNLLYAEQPVATVEGLARLRERLDRLGIPVLIAADESVRKAEDPLRVAALGAADVIVVKAAPLGGVRRAAEIVRQSGLLAVVSSALESSVGISAGVALAASLPQLPFGCGLGTVSLMESDTVAQPLVASHGEITVRRVVPEENLLDALEAPIDRRQWWQQRITACYGYLEG